MTPQQIIDTIWSDDQAPKEQLRQYCQGQIHDVLVSMMQYELVALVDRGPIRTLAHSYVVADCPGRVVVAGPGQPRRAESAAAVRPEADERANHGNVERRFA